MTENISSSSDPVIERRIRRRLLRLMALTIIIFICGGAAGWGVGVLLRRPPAMSMGFGPEPPMDRMVHQLREELLLSDDQVKQIRQIYQQREDALQAIRQKMEPELKSEYDKLDQQMKRVLNSAQYQRWNERFQSVRSRMLPPPPPLRPGEQGPGPDGPPGPGRNGPGPQGDGPDGQPNRGPPDGMPPP
jgi:hypothetical protein